MTICQSLSKTSYVLIFQEKINARSVHSSNTKTQCTETSIDRQAHIKETSPTWIKERNEETRMVLRWQLVFRRGVPICGVLCRAHHHEHTPGSRKCAQRRETNRKASKRSGAWALFGSPFPCATGGAICTSLSAPWTPPSTPLYTYSVEENKITEKNYWQSYAHIMKFLHFLLN